MLPAKQPCKSYRGTVCCFWILSCCLWSALSSSRNNSMRTVVDMRGQSPYKYQQINHRIGTITKFSKMEISFDLKVDRTASEILKIPVLWFEGSTMRLIFYIYNYLSGWGEFGIMHHNSADEMGEYKQLLDCNLLFLSRNTARITTRPRHRYSIVILDDAKVTVDIDGYPIYHGVHREICLQNETMGVWLDGSGFKFQGTIGNLLIQTD